MLHRTRIAAAIALLVAGSAVAAPPKVVTAPNSDPQCFAPWASNTKMFQYPAKKGPYRIALANGYIANTWRIQMIKTAKAYAAQKDVAAKLKEFKVVSTGEDVAAQIAAINNFIDSGYDAIVVNAQNPAAFKPVIKRANDAGVVLVAFDNILDTEEAINVNVDQKGLGKYWAEWLVKNVPNGGKVLEVRGVSGTSVDRDRHDGIHEVFKASGKKWDVVEVIGKWDDPTAQKVTADAIAVHKKFDGITAQGGDTGVVQAMIDAKHPFVPFGGETENGFRKFCGKHGAQGLKCASAGTGPAQVAVAIKTAIAALEGKVVPQSVKLPLAKAEFPNMKEGTDFYPAQNDNFFVGNAFPTCGINFTAQEIMGQTEGEREVSSAAGAGSDPRPLFLIEGVSKRYGGVRALSEAHLAVRAGRIHAVLGENGAGKSTLIKIMAGVVAPDEGRMLLDGAPVAFASPADAQAAGIACIFQELSLIPDLSVADNIGIADPPRRFGLIDRRAQRRMAEEALARAGADNVHPSARVADLSLSRRQMVEIAKALARKPRILILDEATSALTAADVTKVFAVLKRLRTEGLALVYISHRMHEIAELADECTVFRNGRSVASYPAGTRTDAEIVELMIGREVSAAFPPHTPRAPDDGPPLLEARGLTWTDELRDVSFALRAGEVVGLGGLDGQGQRELLLALFGVLRGMTGEVRVDGAPVDIGSPSDAKRKAVGMALIPEDRKSEGLMLPMSVRDNLSFAALDTLSPWGVIDRAAERDAVDRIVKLLGVRCDGTDVPAGALSGGNQQKLVIGKWLMVAPRILLLNDPTRGIDVGTKQELYLLLRELAAGGAGILFYSTDVDELVGCCHRVLVMVEGAIRRELAGDAITEHALVSSALDLAPA